MITDKFKITEAKNLMQILIPDSVYLETSGDSGGMVFTIAMDKINQLGPIFCIMEGSAESNTDLKISDKQRKAMIQLSKIVTDVGASQTTLEEVFMAVTS